MSWCWFPTRQFRRTRGGREGCVQGSFWGRGGARGFSCWGLAVAWADLQGRLRRALRSAAVVRHFHARAARVVFWWSQRPILGSPNLDPVLTSTLQSLQSANRKHGGWSHSSLQETPGRGLNHCCGWYFVGFTVIVLQDLLKLESQTHGLKLSSTRRGLSPCSARP